MKTLEPKYKWSELDILTDRNNIRKLLRWITHTAEKDFRIDLQLVGKTVIFSRWEDKAVRASHEHFGYGHSFEAAYTEAPAGPKILGHHRIIEYVSPALHLEQGTYP